MSSKSVKEYEYIIVRRATQFLERLEGFSGVVDLAAWLGYFTYVGLTLYNAMISHDLV